jgi:hypothetical protein
VRVSECVSVCVCVCVLIADELVLLMDFFSAEEIEFTASLQFRGVNVPLLVFSLQA